MSKLPCIDCITLAICKQQVLKRQNDVYVYLLVPLESKCSIFREYLQYLKYKTGSDILESAKDIADLFNIKRKNIRVITKVIE